MIAGPRQEHRYPTREPGSICCWLRCRISLEALDDTSGIRANEGNGESCRGLVNGIEPRPIELKCTSVMSIGEPRGFGFVEMPTQSEAEAAIKGLNGTSVGGMAIQVNIARDRRRR
jgi:RNA recognition motif-containing protein